MITSKITSLFQFIDFLLANKDNFKKYDEVLREVVQLKKKLRLLNPKENFKDRKRYTAIEAEFSVKMELLLNNVNYPIKTKVEELKICDFNNSLTVYSNNIKEIADFIEYATDEDEKIVSEYKEKYIKYRTENSVSYP